MKRLIVLIGLIFIANVTYAKDWKAHLNISSSPAQIDLMLTIGLNNNGSEQFDTGLDTLTPPPALTYYAYLNSGLASPYTFLKSDIKSSSKEEIDETDSSSSPKEEEQDSTAS